MNEHIWKCKCSKYDFEDFLQFLDFIIRKNIWKTCIMLCQFFIWFTFYLSTVIQNELNHCLKNNYFQKLARINKETDIWWCIVVNFLYVKVQIWEKGWKNVFQSFFHIMPYPLLYVCTFICQTLTISITNLYFISWKCNQV
jgi:hypothetical protein